MKLTEVVLTGRPYKRAVERSYRQPHHANVFTAEDIMASDWEIEAEEKKFPVSKSELNHVFSLGFCANDADFQRFVAQVAARGRVLE